MTDEIKSFQSKRDFLQSLGVIGGSAAVYTAMQGMGIAKAATSEKPPVMNTEANGKKVIILGAGLSGMAMAYEMTKKGYDCKIIEARSFVGGRCQSARKGTVLQEVGGETQVCRFEDDQYLNIGPWRIPAEHKPTIHYCHELGVPLEPMLNESNHALLYSENIEGSLKGKRIKQIDAKIDRQGYISELLAKAASGGKLDDELNEEDVEGLLDYLKSTGLLSRKELNYRANRARGHSEYPGAGLDGGKLSEPFALSDILKVKLAALYHTADHPAGMFQVKGGMDQIAFAFEDNLPNGIISFNSEVTDIYHDDEKVRITYKDTKTDTEKAIEGDFVISTIPYPVLTKIPTNFSQELTDALKTARTAPAYKIGLQFDNRFWEKDEMIYGGSSYSDLEHHGETSYPSSDLHGDKGVILANYIFAFAGSVVLSNMTLNERIEHALNIGEKLHPGKYRKYYNGNAVSYSWHKDKYALGGAAGWFGRGIRKNLPTILKGEKRVLFGGDGASPYNVGWMVGAFESAWMVMKELDKRAAQM
ncbi:flavin monoamine oxidase family protein [Pseudemcibacter aquimaris]|uniref:flavin monoamine oxidase family protein n=1 Tax=Pseudemcibacter aquimaris TaxID=2857064 RepID=UPI002010F4D0|nr:flavin monoamine oxidase family protein [Pseudemcibacter aquimaris]MCC3862120.1 flavin monoamine oxidase family protein [Pseudemcibacter aquimaris]WDU58873.1 flavin monoamine oxidase family protein [Pseudemcibacter aquimaris]